MEIVSTCEMRSPSAISAVSLDSGGRVSSTWLPAIEESEGGLTRACVPCGSGAQSSFTENVTRAELSGASSTALTDPTCVPATTTSAPLTSWLAFSKFAVTVYSSPAKRTK